jgi:hypothetical protein
MESRRSQNMSNKKGGKSAIGDAGDAHRPEVGPKRNKGGRPPGSHSPEQKVRSAFEAVIVAGSRRYRHGKMQSKELDGLARWSEAYVSYLKLTRGGLSKQSFEEFCKRNGNPFAYEEMAGSSRRPETDPDFCPMDVSLEEDSNGIRFDATNYGDGDE